ncbi:MAG: hypothetical protein DIU63_13850 [Proteobacteria bacterium]|nr:MAG: hypothetical protein DIU63_13850 [Pseudomonadota bacterium]
MVGNSAILPVFAGLSAFLHLTGGGPSFTALSPGSNFFDLGLVSSLQRPGHILNFEDVER